MEFKQRTLTQLAEVICGNCRAEENCFRYRGTTCIKVGSDAGWGIIGRSTLNAEAG
jgi:hypothetical protein